MDPERQPLLTPRVAAELRNRRFRPLTSEEVLQSRQEAHWRRTKFCIKFFFWAILAMFLSVITCLLIQAPSCNYLGPTVPPVHLNLAPLVSRARLSEDSGEKANRVFEMTWFQ